MLFTGLESKNKCPSSLMIGCLAYNTARKLPGHGCRGCHKAQIRSSKRQRHAKRLAVAHSDIRPVFCRGLHNSQGHGVAAHDVLGAGLMDDAAQGVPVLYIAVIVGLLHIEAGGLGVCLQHLFQSCPIRYPVFFRNHNNLCIAAKAVCLHDLDNDRICSRRNIGCGFLSLLTHGNGFRRSRGTVVYGCIGGVHSCEFTEHGLILEYGLEDALADFRLIRRIGSDKLLF